MRILVTGASGFIGSYLSDHLLNKGHQVIAGVRKKDPETLTLLNRAEFIELDVLNNEDLQQKVHADAIIHIATSNDIVSRNALDGITLSAIGTKNMLEFALSNNIKKFICFSTFQVYGTELTGTVDENSETAFVNDYGLNHMIAEHYVQMYARNNKLTGIVVRPSNVYGEIKTAHINRWTLVPACFCKEAFEKQSITILSSGKQIRNFVNLKNVSIAVESILSKYPEQFEVFNIAGKEVVNMLEVAEKVKKAYESMFGKIVEIKVEGKLPEKGNLFSVDHAKLESTGFKENEVVTLETEIEKIFIFLTNKNTHQ